jgi:nitroreductase
VVVSDPDVRHRLREAAEECERAFYGGRASEQWLDSLAPLGTGPVKPFLETAPILVAVFVVRRVRSEGGDWVTCPYALESVGIATGMLVTALHHAGLACLTYTPSPMRFLHDMLQRPPEERPFVLVMAGYPADGAVVPAIERKSLSDVIVWS